MTPEDREFLTLPIGIRFELIGKGTSLAKKVYANDLSLRLSVPFDTPWDHIPIEHNMVILFLMKNPDLKIKYINNEKGFGYYDILKKAEIYFGLTYPNYPELLKGEE